MTRRLVVLPEAEEDIREAMRWYERRRRGLGAEFLGCIEASFIRAAEAPQACAAWPEDPRYRKVVVSRFPYVVFIDVQSEAVEVVAVAHASREPGFWLARR